MKEISAEEFSTLLRDSKQIQMWFGNPIVPRGWGVLSVENNLIIIIENKKAFLVPKNVAITTIVTDERQEFSFNMFDTKEVGTITVQLSNGEEWNWDGDGFYLEGQLIREVSTHEAHELAKGDIQEEIAILQLAQNKYLITISENGGYVRYVLNAKSVTIKDGKITASNDTEMVWITNNGMTIAGATS